MGNNDNKETPAKQSAGIKREYLERNKSRERRKKTPEQKNQDQMKQFVISVVVFNLATILTLIFLLSIELYFVETFPEYGFFEVIVRFFVACKRVLESSDVIFLVFSLALTVIMEGITARGRATSKFVLTAEGIIGLSALVIYTLEEIHMRRIDSFVGEIPTYLSNNFLMESRMLIHAVYLIGAIFFATLGYYMRAKKMGIETIWKNICMRCRDKKHSA